MRETVALNSWLYGLMVYMDEDFYLRSGRLTEKSYIAVFLLHIPLPIMHTEKNGDGGGDGEVKTAMQILLQLAQDPSKIALRSCPFPLRLCQATAGSEPAHWWSSGCRAAH